MSDMFCECGALKEPANAGLACRRCEPELFTDGSKDNSGGRPKPISKKKQKKIYEAYEKGMSLSKAAEYASVNKNTVQKYWAKKGLKSKNKTELSDKQVKRIKEAIDAGMTINNSANYAGVSRATIVNYKKRLTKDKSSENISRLVKIVEQIHDGVVFAELDELESLLTTTLDNKIKAMLTECISDINGGVYVKFFCNAKKEYRKSCYIYGDKEDLDSTINLLLDEVPCEDSSFCKGGTSNKKEPSCTFRGSYSKVKRAKRLLKSMK